jgi:hypothetical protein
MVNSPEVRPSIAVVTFFALAAIIRTGALSFVAFAAPHGSGAERTSPVTARTAEVTALLNPYAHDGYLSLKWQPASDHARVFELADSVREGNYAETVYVYKLPLKDQEYWCERTLELTVRDIPGKCRMIVDSYLWSPEW